MKLLIACILSLGSMAHAFTVTGTSSSYEQAEAEARAQAQQRCGTITPLQLNFFIYTHSPDDKIISATTEFACYDPATCEASFEYQGRARAEATMAQTQVNYAREICSGRPDPDACTTDLKRKLDAARAQEKIAKAAFLTCTNSN